MRKQLWIAAMISCQLSCAKHEAPAKPACPIGSKTCSCTQGGGCDPGLECTQGRCEAKADTKADTKTETADAKVAPVPAVVAPGVTVELPKVPTQAPSGATIQLTCTKTGEVFVDGTRVADDDELADMLTEALMRDPNAQGVIACDKDADVGQLIGLIDQLKLVGVKRYAIATEKAEPEPEPEPKPVPEP